MKQYVHTVKDPLGIHARPAGLIAKLAKEYADTSIVFSYNGKEAKATSLMKLMLPLSSRLKKVICWSLLIWRQSKPRATP